MNIQEWLREKPLVIWGAGENGKFWTQALTKSGFSIDKVIDTFKHGKKLCGYSVESPELVLRSVSHYHILVTPQDSASIESALHSSGCKHQKEYLLVRDAKDLQGLYGVVVDQMYQHKWPETLPAFNWIEIETINRCNNDCSFCPANKYHDHRKPLKMSQAIFQKIVNELSDMHYDGNVNLFSNNEPLLDADIENKAAVLRKALPKATLHFLTNGLLLTPEKYQALIEHVDHFVVDNYSTTNEWLPSVQRVKSYAEQLGKYMDKTHFVMRQKDAVLSTRGGAAPNKAGYRAGTEGCALPYIQLVVRPDGKVSLCCNDPMGHYTLGDVTHNTLAEIWHSEEYTNVRSVLKQKGRAGLALCAECDMYFTGHIQF